MLRHGRVVVDLTEFDFAVAVANPSSAADGMNGAAAVVTVTRNGQTVATKSVGAGSTEVIMLPWVFELSQNMDQSVSAMQPAQSVLSHGGARLEIDGALQWQAPEREYAAIYDRFAELIESGRSEVDGRPFQLVADAFLIGSRSAAAPFYENADGA